MLDCVHWLGADFENVHWLLDEFMWTAGSAPEENHLAVSRTGEMGTESLPFSKSKGISQ
jgi:hypothetical protein